MCRVSLPRVYKSAIGWPHYERGRLTGQNQHFAVWADHHRLLSPLHPYILGQRCGGLFSAYYAADVDENHLSGAQLLYGSARVLFREVDEDHGEISATLFFIAES
jgi:hypothetical protein